MLFFGGPCEERHPRLENINGGDRGKGGVPSTPLRCDWVSQSYRMNEGGGKGHGTMSPIRRKGMRIEGGGHWKNARPVTVVSLTSTLTTRIRRYDGSQGDTDYRRRPTTNTVFTQGRNRETQQHLELTASRHNVPSWMEGKVSSNPIMYDH